MWYETAGQLLRLAESDCPCKRVVQRQPLLQLAERRWARHPLGAPKLPPSAEANWAAHPQPNLHLMLQGTESPFSP